MTIKITPAIMIGLALIAIAPNARAEIASKAYVDDRDKILLFGTTDPQILDEEGYSSMAENGDVVGAIQSWVYDQGYYDGDSLSWELDDAINKNQGVNDAILVTDNTGNVKLATGGYINNAKVASNAAIEMGKIAFPTPPAICETSGCMLMYYGGRYVWETVTRDNNETISTTGSVSATATTGITTGNSNVKPVECAFDEGDWDSSTRQCGE